MNMINMISIINSTNRMRTRRRQEEDKHQTRPSDELFDSSTPVSGELFDGSTPMNGELVQFTVEIKEPETKKKKRRNRV